MKQLFNNVKEFFLIARTQVSHCHAIVKLAYLKNDLYSSVEIVLRVGWKLIMAASGGGSQATFWLDCSPFSC